MTSFFSPSSKNRIHNIWDNPHFIRLIGSHQVCSDCTLTAYDCTSVYTNMEFNEPIIAVAEALTQVSCPGLEKTILKTRIVQLLEILLTNNHCTSDSKLYHQTIGASAGAIPSPGKCDIRLYQILEQLSESSPHKRKTDTRAHFRDVGYMI